MKYIKRTRNDAARNHRILETLTIIELSEIVSVYNSKVTRHCSDERGANNLTLILDDL